MVVRGDRCGEEELPRVLGCHQKGNTSLTARFHAALACSMSGDDADAALVWRGERGADGRDTWAFC